MAASDILKTIVLNPSAIYKQVDISIFDEIISRYPYFQSGHLLKTLINNQLEGIFQQAYLKHTAIYAGSRTKLFNYLKPKQPIDQIIPTSNEFSASKTEKIPESPSKEFQIISEEKKKRREKNESLIDKFIIEQPSIQKPVAEFYSATGAAAKSLVEHEELATETLADIFVRQQNYKKAIKIYENLSLLYPEKSNKFALLIENLKNKITE